MPCDADVIQGNANKVLRDNVVVSASLLPKKKRFNGRGSSYSILKVNSYCGTLSAVAIAFRNTASRDSQQQITFRS